MKKVFLSLLSIFLLVLTFASSRVLAMKGEDVNEEKVQNKEETLEILLFWGEGCPHCEKAKPFLEDLANSHENITLTQYEIYNNLENAQLLQEYAKKLEVQNYGVPFTVIGDDYFVGYGTDATSGEEIKAIASQYVEIYDEEDTETNNDTNEEAETDNNNGDEDTETNNDTNEEAGTVNNDKKSKKDTKTNLDLPILGNVELKELSLPFLAILLGVVDGFNPCALWALLFLISLLLNMEDRKKMWVLGIIFIATSALVYLLFMTAWLNLFLFVGYVKWMRFLIGAVAIGASIYNFHDFWTNRKGGCKSSDGIVKEKVIDKLKNVVGNKSFILSAIGIALLAIVVNMVEMVCSAGLPAIFTHVLSLNDLTSFQYGFYMVLYILFFMIDDLFVFFIAMITLKATGIEHKYSRASRLIGGIIILIIGLLLIFNPEILMLG